MSPARALAAALALFSGEAAAHASLVESRPPDGARLDAAPAAVELRFDEPVRPITLRLVDATGTAIALDKPAGGGEVLRVPLPQRLGDGRYLLSFRVTSADSHPVGGTVLFTIGGANADPAAMPAAADTEPSGAWRAVARAFRILALLAAAGGALFALAVGGFPRQRAILCLAAGAAAGAIVLGVGLQGAALAGHQRLLDAASWRLGWMSSFGASAAAALGGMLFIAAGALLRAPAPHRLALAAGAFAAIGSLPLTGHALIAHPASLAVAATAAHGLAAAFWAGSLIALLALLGRQPQEASARALRRFSSIAMAAVAVLVVAGVSLAWLQLGGIEALLDSTYGNLVAAKAGLLSALLVLAGLNRWRWLPAFERSGEPRTLRRSIAGEVALVACVGALTAVLVQTPPHAQASIVVQLERAGQGARLEISPGRAGVNTVDLRLAAPREAAEVSMEIANRGAGIEPMTRRLERVAAGHYRRRGEEFAVPGEWQVEIRIRIDDFERLDLPVTTRIR